MKTTYNKIKTFLKNLRYLSNINLKELQKSRLILENRIANLKYEIAGEEVKLPKYKSCPETIAEIYKKKASICRFGDGEMLLMLGASISFQEYSPDLAKRLIEIFKSENENILIAINGYYFGGSLDDIFSVASRDYIRHFMLEYRSKFDSLINYNKTYYNASITAFVLTYGVNGEDATNYYANFIKIFQNQEVVIICGEGIFDDFKINIFEEYAKSVEYMYAPKINAYSQYNEIFEEACKKEKHKLFLIILGPTATVLAYDLATIGFWALDIGHLAKEYNFFKSGLDFYKQYKGRGFFEPD